MMYITFFDVKFEYSNLQGPFCELLSHTTSLYAGSRTDFLRQKSSDIFWRAFSGRGISGEALLVYNFVHSNWLWSGFINPRIRTFVEKLFHGLFSKKKRSKSGGVPSFPSREHVLAENSLPSGQQQL